VLFRSLLIAAGTAGGIGVIGASVFAFRNARRAIAHPSRVTATVTINRPPSEVYALFRDFARLPEFMTYLSSVVERGRSSTWTANLPVLGHVSWRAELIDDIPGQLISWRSEPDSRVQIDGKVWFTRAPGRDATEVRAELQVGGLGKRPSAGLARLFAAPQVKGDLRRFKQVAETGEVLRSDASAHVRPHPAQPSNDAMPAPPVYLPHPAPIEKGALQ